MILKWIFDRVVALLGLLVLWPVLVVVAIMVKVKMPGGPAFFVQKRVGKDGKLFNCHKFRTMTVNIMVRRFLSQVIRGLLRSELFCVIINWMSFLDYGMC